MTDQALAAFPDDGVDTGKLLLPDDVTATVGFDALFANAVCTPRPPPTN